MHRNEQMIHAREHLRIEHGAGNRNVAPLYIVQDRCRVAWIVYEHGIDSATGRRADMCEIKGLHFARLALVHESGMTTFRARLIAHLSSW